LLADGFNDDINRDNINVPTCPSSGSVPVPNRSPANPSPTGC
jgi:hypothetical protein